MAEYSCPTCGNILETKLRMKRHMREFHGVSYSTYLLNKKRDKYRASQAAVAQRQTIEMDVQDVDFEV